MAEGAGYVDLRKFGGLQYSSDPGDVGLERAIAGYNFVLANDGSFVRTRDGVITLVNGTLSGLFCVRLLADTTLGASVNMLAVSEGAGNVYLDSVTTAGVVTAVGNWVGGSAGLYHDMVNFGTPTANTTFITSDGVLLRKYTGGVLSASIGKPRLVAVTPTSNRLVQAGYNAAADTPSGANGSQSTVFFSDAGVPETYTATNYVHLHPGDGEIIRAIVSFNNQTFVFKETKVFIFYGESVGPAGLPEFLWRVVKLTGPRLSYKAPAVAVTAAGVYYLSQDGVYRTAGSTPEKISGPLDELFRVGTINYASAYLWAAGRRLILIDGSVGLVLWVYDEQTGQWSSWNSPSMWVLLTQPFASWPQSSLGSPDTIVFANQRSMFYTDDAVTTDSGNVLPSMYQSGFGDLGSPTPKVVGPSVLWGTGTLTYAMATDYGAADAGTSLVLGTAPTADDRHERRTRRGTKFSYKVSAASGAWRLNNVGLYVRSVRTGGIKL